MAKFFKISLEPLIGALPDDFRLTVVDAGSVGGLHRRWRELRPFLDRIGFDPLDERADDANIFKTLLGDDAREASLHVTRRATMSSTLRPDPAYFAPFWNKSEHIEIVEELAAPMERLDRLLEGRTRQPQAIKIDVQGGERDILIGARQCLERSIMVAEIECSFDRRYQGQASISEILTMMRDAGFMAAGIERIKSYRYRNSFGLDEASLGGGFRPGRLGFCDMLFVREPALLWQRIDEGVDDPLAAILLLLVYNKADLAAATFDRARGRIDDGAAGALDLFFRSLSKKAAWRQRLHRFAAKLARSL